MSSKKLVVATKQVSMRHFLKHLLSLSQLQLKLAIAAQREQRQLKLKEPEIYSIRCHS